MKAAVLTQLGTSPFYEDVESPVPQDGDQLLINIKAASLKNIDRLRAGGKHPASHKDLPAIVGIDGVGTIEDGTRVYAQGLTGMMAQKGLIAKNRYTVLPDKLDYSTAAALPNAVIGSTMALLFRGKMEPGMTILINGATSVTGQVAVQVARHYGAANILVTGRNSAVLDSLKALGANTVIPLEQADDQISKQIKESHAKTPIDLVMDYLWGNPMELVLRALQSGGSHAVRVVTVGDAAGSGISLPSILLRSAAIELVGSGLGSLSQQELKKFDTEVLPEMFQLAADGKLRIDTENQPLEHIHQVWNQEGKAGKRIVIVMN
ncbi:quinone oxidoreductase family protein [Spirosoma areae]